MQNINWTKIMGIIGAIDGALIAGATALSHSPVCTGACSSATATIIEVVGGVGTMLGLLHLQQSNARMRALQGVGASNTMAEKTKS